MSKLKGLGRGLDALLAGSGAKAEEELRKLPVERLRSGKYQPRTRMDEASLDELAASITAQGVMQPILVRPLRDPLGEKYEIVAGERRWRASQRSNSQLKTTFQAIAIAEDTTAMAPEDAAS